MASTEYRPPAPRLQEQDLKGKVALVTGATKGIGRATALELSTRGASILGTYSSPQSAHNFDTLSHTVSSLYSSSSSGHLNSDDPPKCCGIAADITSLSSVVDVIKAIHDETSEGKIDILVLNAVVNVRPKVGTASEADISRCLTGNLHWPITFIESVVRSKMFNQNARVVVISSDRVRDPSPGSGIFNATKAGLESLSRSWALELPLSFPGTTVNAVSVGLTDTPGLRGFPAAAVEALKKARLPKVKVLEGGRLGYAEDVADVVGWLCSEKSRWVTGSVVAANGGAEYIGGSS